MLDANWAEVEDTERFTALPSARRFEFGTRNVADQIGFRTAIEVWEGVGWDEVRKAVEELTNYLKAKLLQDIPGLVLCTPLS